MESNGHDKEERITHRVRLPGFIMTDDEVGLGDVVKSVTYAMGIKPCGGCERRAATLNKWMVFSR
jgi:hypothetical protein